MNSSTSFEDPTLVSYAKDVLQAKGETVHKITRMVHHPPNPFTFRSWADFK